MTDTNAATPNAKVPRIFEHMTAQGPVESLRRTSGVYEFDIQDGGQWFLKLDHGNPTLEPKAEHPDCTIAVSASDFVDIAEGKRNIVTTFLQGRLSYTGDLAFALTFRRLLPVAA